MPSQIKTFTCAAGASTTVGTSVTKILIKMKHLGSAKVVIGESAPVAEPAVDFWTLTKNEPISMSFDVATNVYVWVKNKAVKVEVIRE